jgi:putative alpha-1,2-mannosidase
MYVQSATVDGAPYGRAYRQHADIVKGGTLVFEMGPEPNAAWASAPDAAPYSMTAR